MSGHGQGNQTFDWNDYRSKCTLQTCNYKDFDWQYIPDLGENAALLALFSLSFTAFLIVGLYYRTWGYTIALCLGTLVEIIGYAGRIMSHNNVFDHNAWLMQYICLSIAPAFLTAGIYLTLSRIVIVLGPELSILRPNMYQYIFCTCDFISLCLQGLGGGLAATASTESGTKMGSNIMLAGIVAQVTSMVIFIILAGLFLNNVRNNKNRIAEDPIKNRTYNSKTFRGFIYALAGSLVLIMVRNTYRLAELSEGWRGHLISVQVYFTVFEGFMVAFAVLLLNIFHPGYCFSDGYGRNAQITRKGGAAKGKEAL